MLNFQYVLFSLVQSFYLYSKLEILYVILIIFLYFRQKGVYLYSNKGSITVDATIVSTPMNLGLYAGNNLTVASNYTITETNKNITLYADNNNDGVGELTLSSAATCVTAGTGTIYLQTGGGSDGSGNINTSVTVGKCSTTGGV